MNAREMSEWLRNLNFFACPVAANKIDELAADVERLRKELQELSQYAAGHHAQQESCEWLHALTVDIPHHIEIALGEQGNHA